LPLDPWQSGSVEVQTSAVIRANDLFFRGLAELSVLNARFSYTIFVCGNTPFIQPDSGKNICFDGFFLTVFRGMLSCAVSSVKKRWVFVIN
jgi:hypothetical protein